MANPNKNTTIDYIIGLPPGHLSDDGIEGRTQIVMENSMPIAKIYPGTPSFTKGLNLFTREPAFRSEGKNQSRLSYTGLLNSHGYALKQPKYVSHGGNEGCLVLAYQADSFPTDSFSNEYGENFLQGITDLTTDVTGQIAQMLGARNVEGLYNTVTSNLKKSGGIASMLGGVLGGVGDVAGSIKNALPKGMASSINTISRLAVKGRLDFPMVWKSSNFQPSYTMTVRLYNPNPSSKESTMKYIASPIAAIMLLAIPISEDGKVYSWPFIHKIVSPGIYNLDPAFISNITIIKGGDQQQISFKQSLSIVDIRIDFGSLYNTMLSSPRSDRPTLKTYLDAMVGLDSEKPGVKNFSSTASSTSQQYQEDALALRRNAEIQKTKNQAPPTSELTEEEKDNPPSRVSATLKQEENSLINKSAFYQ